MSLEALGFSIAVIALLLQVLDMWKGRQDVSLGYAHSMFHRRPFNKVSPELEKQVRGEYGDAAAKQIYRLSMRIENTGKAPIQSADYEHPITVTVNEPSKVFDAKVMETSQNSLRPKITRDGKQITLEPLLLNPGDWLVISIWVSQWQTKATIDTRIVGVRKPHELYAGERLFDRLAPFGLVLMLLPFFLAISPLLRVVLVSVGFLIVVMYDLYGLLSIIRSILAMPGTIQHVWQRLHRR